MKSVGLWRSCGISDSPSSEPLRRRDAERVRSDMTRPLPNVRTLNDAVRFVIDSNTKDGYVPSRFIQITQNGDAPNIFEVCRRLITKGELLETLEKDFAKYPAMVTIEDFVAERGREWGFDDVTIGNAQARSEYFDQLVKQKRYVTAIE